MLYVLAFLGGVLTIFSPCVLPVLPFVFSRAGVSFRRSGLPMLLGMALSFSVVAVVAAAGGGWVVRANQAGRIFAVVILGVIGVTLIFPTLATWLTKPFVRMGDRLQTRAGSGAGFGSSMVMGLATGLLWTPCAGPILGLILTGAALHADGVRSWILLLVFAVGAACPLALALLAGGRVFQWMKRSLHAEEWVRRALGVAVLAGVVAISLGWDRDTLTRLSLGSGSTKFEQYLVGKFQGASGPSGAADGSVALKDEGLMPELTGASHWINSPPLTREQLRGKVVLIDFWTYSCINCLRSLPYVREWWEKYKSQGLVVIGVHSPEFAFEREESNVERAVHELNVPFPVANDSSLVIWKAFHNQYWPADYFIDIRGHIRYSHAGEGDEAQSEMVIRRLLAERNGKMIDVGGGPHGSGVEAPPAAADIRSYETYLGYGHQDTPNSPEAVVKNSPVDYTVPGHLDLNDWAFKGKWNVGAEAATVVRAPAAVVFRFHARDLNMVLGPPPGGRPVRFRVTLDGKPAGQEKGDDVDEAGEGVVREQRLYQLIRQQRPIEDRTFEIEFLDPGVQAFTFTFG